MGRTPREEKHFPLHFPLHTYGTSWDLKKKTPGVPTHPRGPVLSLFSPPTSSRCSPVRSRRTVRSGGEDRSWFGRPQAIKKGGRECRQQQGDERVENAGLSPVAPPSSGSQENRGCRLRTAKKKERSLPAPQFDASSPHRREQRQGDGKNTYWSSP